METAKNLYKKAHNLHYKKNNTNLAYYIYNEIIEKYPNEIEARYSQTQISNLEKQSDFKITFSEKDKEKALNYKIEDENRGKVKENNIENMLITSGFDFEGYRIEEYIKFISSEAVLGMGLFKGFSASISNVAGSESKSLKSNLTRAKNLANKEIKEQAARLGANAIIGIDIDYTTFGGELLGVIMSGTAVKVNKQPENN